MSPIREKPLRLDRADRQAEFDERAAIQEYDGELTREAAEAMAGDHMVQQLAAGEIEVVVKDDKLASLSVDPLLVRTGLLGTWDAGWATLSPNREPCPGFRDWPAVYGSAQWFLDTLAEEAEAAGWSTLELFGCHHSVGTARTDCTGALLLGRGARVTRITSDEIANARGHVYRRWPMPREAIPVWEFGR